MTWRRAVASACADVLDVVIPTDCVGCGRPGTAWCGTCDRLLSAPPRLILPRCRPGAPVAALGPYRGSIARGIIAAKDRGRRDALPGLGIALARGLETLAADGHLPRLDDTGTRWVLVPAPTTPEAARARGGDHVAALCAKAARHLQHRHGPWACTVWPILIKHRGSGDSVGHSAAARIEAARRTVSWVRGADLSAARHRSVLFIDDVCTTGATLAAAERLLRTAKIRVQAALVLAAA